MAKKIIFMLLLVLFYSSINACAKVQAGGILSNSPKVPVTVVYSGNQCFNGQNGFQLKALQNPNELNTFLKQNTRTTLGSPQPDQQVIDFSRNALVALWMGKKPTAGYRISLAAEKAEIKNGTANLRVNLQEPKPNTVSAQVITSPCLLLALPKKGYDAIAVIAQKNDQLAKISIRNTTP